jgi:cleavage and polyadenylation specificity factor subunit 3
MKRAAPTTEWNTLNLKPLGAGNEVGRSCLILRFKGLTIMLDCGVLPSFSGEEALPLLREINPAEVDVVIIT